MKKIRKNIHDRPGSLVKGFLHFDNAIAELGRLKKWPEKYSTIYKSERVKEALIKLYHNKCAFCNQIPKGSPIQVEHFRPKNGIMNEAHSGYYWLGYEWSNLLLACGNCNSTKNNNFPLMPGTIRIPSPIWIGPNEFDLSKCISTSIDLRDEKFVLLNPELDHPDNHLFYELDGKINFYTGDIRGEESISKYNLNRDELYINGRKQILDDIIEKLGKRYKKYKENRIDYKALYLELTDVIIEEIIEPIMKNDSFDHFRHWIYSHYEEYILTYLGDQKLKEFMRTIIKNLHLRLLAPKQYLPA